MSYPFYILDVFAEEKYAGNQLAVIRNAQELSSQEMLQITREMNYSESTFILSDEKKAGGFDVRIFTPGEEVPFAGHPSLGTAYLIQKEIIGDEQTEVILNLKVGQIPVKPDQNDSKILWMKQNQPIFGKKIAGQQMADLLQVEVGDLNLDFPIQEVSTGLPFIIVPFKTLQGVKKAKIHQERLFELIKDLEAKAILIFCPETYHARNDLNVRVFVDYYDIPEDPATGSANGCLAGYLAKYRYFGQSQVQVRVEQGYEIQRPSLIHLHSEDRAGEIRVHVGGRVVLVAKGELI